MTRRVTVVDYGLGNLFSVSRALEQVGASPDVTDSPGGIDAATCLVLPGVGAFADGMNGLLERRLVEPLRRYGASGRPLLGICLGMQLMFDSSEEFGSAEGLGLILGSVVSIPSEAAEGTARKVPHIGWNELRLAQGRLDWTGTPLAAVPPGTPAYFVHSFSAAPADPSARVADADHDGWLVTAAVGRGNLFGCQFHPEKSGPAGLRILQAFVRGG
jgi:glutamine amidotransferase